MQAYQIASLIVSILTLFGFGTIMKHLIDDAHDKQKQNSIEEKAKQKIDRQNEIKEVLHSELEPLKKEIELLKETDTFQRKGIQAILRDRMYQLNKTCFDKHYTTLEDRENFENMYQQYHALAANGVMTDMYSRFFNLPSEEQYLSDKRSNNDNFRKN